MATLDRVLEQHQGLHIVMVPSIRDAHHSFVYPQPPFNKKKACEALGSPDTAKRVHMMSNPCTFAINNVVFGVSALDIVMHLSSSELYRYVRLYVAETMCRNSSCYIDRKRAIRID